jgi:hypothetical protein
VREGGEGGPGGPAPAPPDVARPHAPRLTHLAPAPSLFPLVRAPVCFLRNLFPSDCFRTTSFGNTTIRALCPREVGADGRPQGKVLNEDAALLTAWQESAFDALEKGYLRCVRRAVGGGRAGACSVAGQALLPNSRPPPSHPILPLLRSSIVFGIYTAEEVVEDRSLIESYVCEWAWGERRPRSVWQREVRRRRPPLS